MFDDLIAALRDTGTARIELDEGTSTTEARMRLIEIARQVGVRVTMKRDGNAVIATVLTPQQGQAQHARNNLFRAANKIKDGVESITNGVEILKVGGIGTNGMEDDIEDLKEIVRFLEEEARELFREATAISS